MTGLSPQIFLLPMFLFCTRTFLKTMKIMSYSGMARSSFWLLHFELPIITFSKLQLTSSSTQHFSIRTRNGNGLLRLHCSVADRTLSSTSLALSSSKLDTSHGFSRPQKASPSLYTHPSLAQMKTERTANRARVYDFLRSIGIVPDELDGLELPVTVEVMRERVDFLHTLGLTIEDINNYPLVLGCSVKKNMVPVLDYLGKLGVRKSTFTQFLHRYPQVLHSSVIVDLAPVVK